jgi:septum formation protein
LALLRQAGLEPGEVAAPEVDESPRRGELPRAYALRVAWAKAEAAPELGNAVVLAADTVVARGRLILPKAETDADVARCLGLLSGRRHQVLTAVMVRGAGAAVKSRLVMTRVTFKRLSAEEIASYVACGEGLHKAGGYAIQGRAEAFVRGINGSYSNVVGLPLLETLALLRNAGIEP